MSWGLALGARSRTDGPAPPADTGADTGSNTDNAPSVAPQIPQPTPMSPLHPSSPPGQTPPWGVVQPQASMGHGQHHPPQSPHPVGPGSRATAGLSKLEIPPGGQPVTGEPARGWQVVDAQSAAAKPTQPDQRTAEGRPSDDWVVVLGDVCGKGVEAAVITALVRYTLRSVTVRLQQPTQALQELNDVLLRHPSGRFCTVALLRLSRADDGWQLTMSLGGHPQPLLLRSGTAETSKVGTPGSLVGVLDEPDFTETSIRLAPGDSLVIYTDGVTEGRLGREQYGEQRLRATASRHARSPGAIPQAVLVDVLEFQGGTARDDIAVVSVGVPSGMGE